MMGCPGGRGGESLLGPRGSRCAGERWSEDEEDEDEDEVTKCSGVVAVPMVVGEVVRKGMGTGEWVGEGCGNDRK